MADRPNFFNKMFYSLPGNQGGGEDKWNSQGRGWAPYKAPEQTSGKGTVVGYPNTNTGVTTQTPTNYLDDMLKAIRAAQTPAPRIANWNYADNWAKAMEQGKAEAQSLYDAKIAQLAKRIEVAKNQARGKYNLAAEGIQMGKDNTLQDNQVNRVRTAEDTTKAIENINQAEGIYQTDEGQAFDQNYRQVAEQLAASGAAGTGLGKQQTSDMIRLRNVQNQRQLDEFQGQREAKQLFKDRTFEDLLRGDQRAEQLAANSLKGAKFDLDSALEDIAIDEDNNKFVYEIERGNNATERGMSIYDTNVNNWLAGLSGQGYNANDIATTASIYKR